MNQAACADMLMQAEPGAGDWRARPPTSVVFDGCAGWLHAAAGDHAAILCGPIGQEELAVHTGWRQLAQMLAEAGVSALRFDYPNTGDSEGDEASPDRIAAWVDSIVAAAAWLRRTAGITRITLIGVRLGATLAAMAAPRIEGVECLAMLAPVITGRLYIREMRLLAVNWWAHAAPNDHEIDTPPGCLDVIGYRWDPASLQALGELDLRKLTSWPARVILMDGTSRPDVVSCTASLQAAGVDLAIEDFAGAAAFLQDALRSEVPKAAFARLCTLLAPPRPSTANRWPRLPAQILNLADCVEHAMEFGPSGVLRGVLCRPRSAASGKAVLLLNTGLTHHVGHARLTVILARRLAAIGITSLRMDGAGIGESDLPPGQPAPTMYETDSTADVTAAIDALQDLGHGSVTVLGACSGGHQAFHSALVDARIDAAIIVNIQKFIWMGGPIFNVSYDGNRRETAVYVRAALSRRNWSRVWRGEVKPLRIATDLLRRSVRTRGHKAMQLLETATGWHTRAGRVQRWLRQLDKRGVRVRLIYSESDPGLADLRNEASPAVLQRQLSGLSVEVLPNADHTLSSVAARDAFIARMIEHFSPQQ